MRAAFVLIREAVLPTPEDVVAAHRPLSSGGEVLFPAGGDEGTLLFELGHEPLHVALMPQPVPEREAEMLAPCSVGSLADGWSPERHGAHLLVVFGEDEARPARARLRDFTRALAAVSAAADSVAVYWGDAGATHSPEFFQDLAGDELPALLWTGVSLARPSPDRVSFLSLGLARQLGLMDVLLEAPAPRAKEALGFFFDLVAYAAGRDESLPAGDVVGRTLEERLPVRHVPSPVEDELLVARVELP